MSQTARQQRHAQLHEKLRRELGNDICQALGDDDVIEIIANPDGAVWWDRLSIGMAPAGVTLSEAHIESAIGTVAAMHDQVVHAASPRLKAELPLDGSRFQGFLRPVSPPMFVIRKQLKHVITLAQQVEAGTLTAAHADVLRYALRKRWNIVIVGATLSGKTVLANSLLDALRTLFGDHLRLVLIEDTYELRCTAPNVVHLHTCEAADLRTLVQDTLRVRPDRIIVGEVRGAEALELLKSWNTGHPGGITTVHADTAAQALLRLESLVEEAGVRPNPRMIASTIHLIVMMERIGSRAWRVQDLLRVHGWDAHTQRYQFSQIQSLQEVGYETESEGVRNGNGVGAAAGGKLGRNGRHGLAVGSTHDHD